MRQGLIIEKRENYHRLIVEEDSTMFIRVISKFQQGTRWEKIIKIWRKTCLIQDIGALIQQIQDLIPLHVRRIGNETIFFLANWGCQNEE